MTLSVFLRSAVAAVVVVAGLAIDTSMAGPPVPYRMRAGLNENYYVNPSAFGGEGAKMYPSPLPVPAWVGHTYYTYEGLYPHEHLYPHYRVYHRTRGLQPINTTRILYW